jgi:hypothetical protein
VEPDVVSSHIRNEGRYHHEIGRAGSQGADVDRVYDRSGELES